MNAIEIDKYFKLYYLNMESSTSEEKWLTKSDEEPGICSVHGVCFDCLLPDVVYVRVRTAGKFWEQFELEDFPFDYQELSIWITAGTCEVNIVHRVTFRFYRAIA